MPDAAEDRSTSQALQRVHAARATASVDLTTGHHAFLARPELAATEIIQIIEARR